MEMDRKHHINTDTFQFFEYTQTVHWLNTKANETVIEILPSFGHLALPYTKVHIYDFGS